MNITIPDLERARNTPARQSLSCHMRQRKGFFGWLSLFKEYQERQVKPPDVNQVANLDATQRAAIGSAHVASRFKEYQEREVKSPDVNQSANLDAAKRGAIGSAEEAPYLRNIRSASVSNRMSNGAPT